VVERHKHPWRQYVFLKSEETVVNSGAAYFDRVPEYPCFALVLYDNVFLLIQRQESGFYKRIGAMQSLWFASESETEKTMKSLKYSEVTII
jgi:hypothetical protein